MRLNFNIRLILSVLTLGQIKCTMSVLEMFQRCKQEKSKSDSAVRSSHVVRVTACSLTRLSDQRLVDVDTAFYIHLAKWLTLTPDLSLSHNIHIPTIKQ